MWLDFKPVVPPPVPAGWKRRVVVAVPACDEAASIGACLAALDIAAARALGSAVTIVVAANNCRDDTAAQARAYVPGNCELVVEEVVLPFSLAHAGGARRHVMDRAARLAGRHGIILTTDADSCVDAGWIVANLGEIAAGADAVAGMIAFDGPTRALLPELSGRGLEWRLATLHARLGALVDPAPHDPWPRHIWAWGASLGLTAAAYRTVGGLPVVPLAEDRALAEAIERADLRLRRSHAPLVYTSSRRVGRAPGGFADLLAGYASDPAMLCDAALEPTAVLLQRLVRKARLRAAHRPAGFGAAWATVEATTPELARRRVRPEHLAEEVRLAERLVTTLERRGIRRDDNLLSAIAA